VPGHLIEVYFIDRHFTQLNRNVGAFFCYLNAEGKREREKERKREREKESKRVREKERKRENELEESFLGREMIKVVCHCVYLRVYGRVCETERRDRVEREIK